MAKKHAWLVLVAVVLAFGIPTVSWAGGAGGGESYGETTLTVEGMT